MSAEVFGSVSPVPDSSGPAAARPLSAALAEPSLVTRLLAVAATVFAVPVGVELHALLAGSVAPGAAALAGCALAGGVLAGGFGALLRGARHARELRAGRVLLALLGAEATAIAAALLARLV